MLYNPTWNAELNAFKDWLKTKDPEETFHYADYRVCAVGQFWKFQGKIWKEQGATDYLNQFASMAYTFANSQGRRDPNFGDVLLMIEREQGNP